jgi:hypothetical protein
VQRLRREAEAVATDAYKAGRALGPLAAYASDLHRLSKVAPALGARPGGEAAARELSRAEAAERTANQEYRAAADAHAALTRQRDVVKASFEQRTAVLTALRSRNAAEVARAEAESDAYERSVGARLNLAAVPTAGSHTRTSRRYSGMH